MGNNLSDYFKGIEQLIDLARQLEEKARDSDPDNPESDQIKVDVQFRSRPPGGNIPRTGNIPPRRGPATGGTSSDDVGSEEPVVRNRETTKPESNSSPDEGEAAEPKPLSLTEVGGLQDVLAQLREMVEIPLKRPDILDRLGLEPPRGVLMVGPPGTGKTLTARALAEALGVNYIAIVGPEIIGKYYGEAEGRLRQVFQKATKSAPCLIFIDEIDALVPNRSQVEGEVEKRLVAQMLGLMDGFAASKGVIVLAATNRAEAIDPALRRPGRFDREVYFKVPSRDGRREILGIHTRGMPLAEDVNLDNLADLSVGYVGADIKGLCQAAAFAALRRQVPNLASIPQDLKIAQADFETGLKQIQPSVLRSVQIESPDVSWEQIGGLEEAKQTLREAVEGTLTSPELYAKTRARAPHGIILSGPPGTGKTLLAKAVASQAQANFIALSGPELMTKWVGASEQAIRELFARARQAAPCVIFIDELDTLAPARGRNTGDSGVSDRVIGQLLTELDGVRPSQGVLLVAATNRKDSIDAALLRAGRLELHVSVDLPSQSSRRDILSVHNQERPLAADVDLDHWAELTEGWNGADLALLSNQAAISAIRLHRAAARENQELTADSICITQTDFQRAYEELMRQRT
ncbi:AAA family ATPase [Leptolyngbya sp. FACHB-261]|uniref:AAA family ATPase n=1 Tax=Leptolyngbya sp. FACHB-261 TaxID=2692806 RepID=UPI001687B2E5|nr:AAA family ATPase [Leptolyngbya sp. FACHB-261]MBD2104265.1 AAA family ATPase [Leptolyngbya sp. FACHB-261]